MQELIELKRTVEPQSDVVLDSFCPCTDLGNAERLVVKYGAMLRYSYQRKAWLHWVGTHWKVDRKGYIMYLAKETVKSIYGEAELVQEKERRIELSKWAVSSESEHRISAMISLAQSEFGIPILDDDLNRNIMLFNCLNGTINLESGELQDSKPSDYITVCVPINFNGNDGYPLWAKFLDDITDNNIELQEYLQRAVGYSLTGSTRGQVLFFLYGLGSNGKSTFTMTIRKLMGEYGERLEADDLMLKDKRTGGGPKEGIANLHNKRYIVGSELQDGRRLDTSLVKDMTGGETIKARRLYEHDIEFMPTFKLWLYGNHKPTIADSTLSIWRRIKQIPFGVTITDIDDDLQTKLEAELPGILAWAVQGCLMWQKTGLNEPKVVSNATARYRHDQDILGDFLEDRCVIENNAIVPKIDLKTEYQNWCQDNGIDPVTQKTFKNRLIEKGISDGRSGDGKKRIWRGIRLSTPQDILEKITDISDKTPLIDKKSCLADKNNSVLQESLICSSSIGTLADNGSCPVSNVRNDDDLRLEYPHKPCFACQGTDFHLTRHNTWLCDRCHPDFEEI